MMPRVLDLCFNPTDKDAPLPNDIVVKIGEVGCLRWKKEMLSRESGKTTHEHMSASVRKFKNGKLLTDGSKKVPDKVIVGGIRSEGLMTEEEKLTGN